MFAERQALEKGDGAQIQQKWLFRSYDHFVVRRGSYQVVPSMSQNLFLPESPLNPGRGTELAAWKVARAATAAPGYFKPLDVAIDDGGVITDRKIQNRITSQLELNEKQKDRPRRTQTGLSSSEQKTHRFSDAGFISRVNNPSEQILYEVQNLFQGGPKRVDTFISIGTGRQKPRQTPRKIRSLLKIAIDNTTDTEGVHEAMERNHSRAANSRFAYYRLNQTDALGGVKMDDWRPSGSGSSSGRETLASIRAAFGTWTSDPNNHEKVHEAALRLVEIRRRRAANIAKWERFALGRYYVCPTNNCDKDQSETWHDRDLLKDHLTSPTGCHRFPSNQADEALGHCWFNWEYQAPAHEGTY